MNIQEKVNKCERLNEFFLNEHTSFDSGLQMVPYIFHYTTTLGVGHSFIGFETMLQTLAGYFLAIGTKDNKY